ncbi:multidrug efflux RND transporter permease subunit [Rhizobium sp. BK418]|uniref:efflux RND transporter permease subunit n=1 Tax=Rhizobium sp. BK418 TaxID=2512120 RepID=UPI0010DC778E|nr:multidrug efflux RND transporter permease subunit [Rhizobium sp. BK418]TCS00939.1 multidrug efflux pump [Rhizobium sp. BK418]
MLAGIFIKRPRLAMVIAIAITLAGAIALVTIPVSQFPEITPPTVQVTASYPGADAQTLAQTVAAPIEQQVNGVEGMTYMSSSASASGTYALTVTFAVGTDPDIAQINVQNRVALAQAQLPATVRNLGVNVRSQQSNFLMVVNLFSPGGTHDSLFLSNFAKINIADPLSRVRGVGSAQIMGALDYSMRIWLNPIRMAALSIVPSDVTTAIQQQNIQAAAGLIGAPPIADTQVLQYSISALGPLSDPTQFGDIIVRTNNEGGIVRIRDIARVELGAASYNSVGLLDGQPTATIALYQSPGSNAIAVARDVRTQLNALQSRLPADVSYRVVYDATAFVNATITEIIHTLVLTGIIVILVVYLFLQSWRATLIPALTIPVSLVGVFAILLVLGYSANTVTLFAIILAIGLVVDDAIVVVENVQRVLAEDPGISPAEAAEAAMKQVTGPIISTTLVLVAIFAPVGFLPGITGELYRQFAVTIIAAVAISSVNALTLSPALCAILLRHGDAREKGPFAYFNRGLNKVRKGYVGTVASLARRSVVAGLIILLIAGICAWMFGRTPTGFLPTEDQGIVFVNVQLPDAAALPRTQAVLDRVTQAVRTINGVDSVITVSGTSLLSGAQQPNSGLVLLVLKPWSERMTAETGLGGVLMQLNRSLASISEANVIAFPPPSIPGLGVSGGFDLRLQALGGQSPEELAQVTRSFIVSANSNPRIGAAFSTFSAEVPGLYLNLDRVRAENLHVPTATIFDTLQTQLGSSFVNNFNIMGQTYQVNVAADSQYRGRTDDILNLYVRSTTGAMVPLRALVSVSQTLQPTLLPRYNQFTAATVNGQPAAGVSSGQAMEALTAAAGSLPEGYGFEWSGLSYQEATASAQTVTIFVLALIFGYLFLVAQYESWSIPLSVITSVAVAILGALIGIHVAGIDLNVYVQIGLVLLVGLAAKNAILIVEFSKEAHEAGQDLVSAAIEGAHIRFRAVLMTALATIFGALPLVFASGAGAASRVAIGMTIIAGMLAAAAIGIILIPALYVFFDSIGRYFRRRQTA